MTDAAPATVRSVPPPAPSGRSSLDPALGAELRAWLDGTERWRVVHGEALALLTHLPNRCVDSIITDPPYSSGGAFRGDRQCRTGEKYIGTNTRKRERQRGAARADFEGDTRDQKSFYKWAWLWLFECYRVAKRGALVGVWADWRQVGTVQDALQAAGFCMRGIWGWDKGEGCRPVKGRPRNQLEFVVWGSKGPMSVKRCRGVVEAGVVRFTPTFEAKGKHQTGKPVEVLRTWARLTEPGGLLLDPFAGHASMGVAILDEGEGRRYLGFEVGDDIHPVAVERMAKRNKLPPADGRQLSLLAVA